MTVADVIASSGGDAGGRKFIPVTDRYGKYIGMADIYGAECHDSATLADIARASRPVEASSPVSLLMERMAAGEKTVAVVEDGSPDLYIGAVDTDSILRIASSLFPQLDDYTELTIVCPSGEYSASAIAHAVEDADAHLLNLNVVAGTMPNSPTTVHLRVNHSRGESVARSLARYGYDTVEMAGTPGYLNADMIERVNALLHYLEV